MTTLAPSTQMGRYKILAHVGGGGMGEVYKARDTRLGRVVALKVSKRPYDKSFEREAKAVAALNHPNICTLFDVGPNYLVMEYVEGAPLKGQLSVEEVIPYALQICDALAAAHEKGITHRDLKPSNILVTKSGIKLLDFGLAKTQALSEEDNSAMDTHTPTGTILGTHCYMSPEQAQGEPVDSRSDIFAFGALLYELVSGRKAFQGPTVLSTLTAILRDEPEPLKTAPKLKKVIARCLRKQPSDRYQSMADLRDALEGCLDRHLGVSTPIENPALTRFQENPDEPLSPIEVADTDFEAATAAADWVAAQAPRVAYLSRRSSSAIWVCGVSVLTILVGVATWRSVAQNGGVGTPEIYPITATLAENRVTAAAVSPDGKRLAYAERGGGLIVQDLKSGDRRLLQTPEHTLIETVSWIGSTGRILISGETDAEARALWVQQHPSDSGMYILRRDARHGIASPDGQQIAFTNADETEIWIMTSDGRSARRLVIGGSTETFPVLVFSSDSRRVSYQRRRFTTEELNSHTRNDGENNVRRTFETVDLSGGIVDTAAIGMASGCMLDDGRILFLQPEENNAHDSNLWELRTDARTGKLKGRPRRLTQWREKELAGISCSPDGRFVGFLVQRSQSDIYIGEPVSGSLQATRRLTQENVAEYPHAWSPDSATVIFEKPGKTGWDLYFQRIDEGVAYPLATEKGSKITPQVSPDGEWVLYCAFEDGSAAARAEQKLMRVPITGGPRQLVPTGQFDEFRCALKPGKRCVLRTIENRQFVYSELDPARGRGKELARTAWAPSVLGDWALSADGTEVAVPNHDPRQTRILLIRLDTSPDDTPATRELEVPGLGGLVGLIADANDGGWFASATSSRGVRLLHINRSGQFRVLRECPTATWGLPSPDGRLLAFIDHAAYSNFWSVRLF